MKTSSSLLAMIALVALISSRSLALPPPALRTACGFVADAEEVVGNKAMQVGKAAFDLAMKPVAIVGGLKAAAVGTGMKVGGGAIRFVGEKMAKDGGLLEATGAGIKGAGLGVAALSVKPFAEKVVAAGNASEAKVDAAKAWIKSAGDTSIQVGATIDSPVIGHHHKEITMNSAPDSPAKGQAEQAAEQQQQAPQESHAVGKRATSKVDPEVLRAAINLVKEAKMEDCVARAICDLNCNPQGFGQDGKQVFMNMVRLQGSNSLESTDSKYFHEAATKGRNYSANCEQCSSHFHKCKSKSADLIKLASHIKMD